MILQSQLRTVMCQMSTISINILLGLVLVIILVNIVRYEFSVLLPPDVWSSELAKTTQNNSSLHTGLRIAGSRPAAVPLAAASDLWSCIRYRYINRLKLYCLTVLWTRHRSPPL